MKLPSFLGTRIQLQNGNTNILVIKTYLTVPNPPPILRMLVKESASGELPLAASLPGCGFLKAMVNIMYILMIEYLKQIDLKVLLPLHRSCHLDV